MTTIFTKIINREIPGFFLYEDDTCVAILDKFPAVEGQAMVILKREVSYLFDTTEEEYTHLLQVSRRIAHALDTTLNAERTCMVVEGFEVPHVHIKLFPFKETEDTNLAQTMANQSESSDEELTALAERIKASL